jgi:dTDP-4-dehydrorhamnose reductase
MKVLILGTGFLGKKLFDFFKTKGEAIATDIKPSEGVLKLDVTNKQEVEDFLKKQKPDIVIDTVGVTSSVQCEKDPELAEKLNYLTAKYVADVCKEIGARMVFISSSYVFDGEKGNYNEEDEPNSTRVYAKTKLKAEKEALSVPNSIVIRQELMYGTDNGNIRYGSATLSNNNSIAITDQIRQPMFVDDVPRTIYDLLEEKKSGIFNVAGPEKMTMLGFLKNLVTLKKDAKIEIKDKSTLNGSFPQDVSLDISKIKSLGINPTPIERALEAINKNLSQQP